MCTNETLLKIDNIISRINGTIKTFSPEFVFFKPTHQKLRHDKSEAAYFNNVDYYYGLFFERGDVFKRDILQKIQLYNLDYPMVKTGIDLIHDLRTFKSHTLDKSRPHDRRIINNVEKWYYTTVGSKTPTQSEIIQCSTELNEKALMILECIEACLTRIKVDSNYEAIIQNMVKINSNYFPDFAIEEKFSKAIREMQLSLDATALTKKYSNTIRGKMELLDNTDSEQREINLERCVEELLYTSKDIPCPLSATDIMGIYGISQGKNVGKLKQAAVAIFETDIFMTADEIAEKLIEKYPIGDYGGA